MLLFTYSCLLTKGVNEILSEMDNPNDTHLTERFQYCSQELVNLLLCGVASTNTFDGIQDLSSGDDKGLHFYIVLKNYLFCSNF